MTDCEAASGIYNSQPTKGLNAQGRWTSSGRVSDGQKSSNYDLYSFSSDDDLEPDNDDNEDDDL